MADGWLIKYKPKNFSEILGQDNVINIVKENLKRLPHMIFYGPPGLGKTTLINIVATELYGKNKNKNTLILNASDERGIDTVRNKIKHFAKQKIYSTKDETIEFKLIILDEADSMTPEAQTALRRIMEKYSEITRFCFICNYVNKIIKPISSRCAIFRFKKVDTKLVEQRLNYICNKENCQELKETIPIISLNTNGDLRQSIIMLESVKKLGGDITNMCGIIKRKIRIKFDNFEDMMKEIDLLFFDSYNIFFLMREIKNEILNSELSDFKKADLLVKLNICQTKINQGCDEKLQFYYFFSNLINDKKNLSD